MRRHGARAADRALAVGAAAPLAGCSGGRIVAERKVDVLLIGGGIMSATLGVLLRELEPNWTQGPSLPVT